MTFGQAVRVCFEKYAVFIGRAARPEFWYWTLFTIILSLAVNFAVLILNGGAHGPFNALSSLVALALFLPGLAVQVRRLHDLDKSGWWMLIALIPLIGWIVLLVWFCARGTTGPNRFGGDPLNIWAPSGRGI